MNHNQILGVSAAASSTEIQSAFRKAALEVHPDHSNSPEAAEAFMRIKEARDQLMKNALDTEAVHDTDSIQRSSDAAIKATTNATYSTQTDDLFDGFTPEEIKHIQALDQLVAQRPKRTLLGRVKESVEVRRHRKKISTTNNRIIGKY